MYLFKALVALAMASIALALPEPVPQLACAVESGGVCLVGVSEGLLCCSTGLTCTAVDLPSGLAGLAGDLPIGAGVRVASETV